MTSIPGSVISLEVRLSAMSAIGGEPVTTTVEGRDRYTVNVCYGREWRYEMKHGTMDPGQIPIPRFTKH